MKINRIMIAAPKSGSGKTTVTCALLKALQNKGEKVISYKCGPDYIDPMFHEKVIGIPSGNLDTFFTGEEKTRRLLVKHAAEGEFAVLEGVMGIYDGLGGVREEGSSYHLAKVTKTPIVLVADVRGIGQSVVALLAGFLAYDTEHLIRGVILNRISRGYYETVKPLIEKELKLSVLGFMPEQKTFQIESRHLGLILPGEMKDIKERLEGISREFEKSVSLSAIRKIAESAGEINACKTAMDSSAETGGHLTEGIAAGQRPVIAVARDEAFCFYYEDNLLLLKESGAKIIYFSPLHDRKLPHGCHGLLFGGGYPELYAEKLSQNTGMYAAIRKAVKGGIPVVAECGGFMYLHSSLTDRKGNIWPMAGVLPATCFDTGKTVRFGYIEIQEKSGCFLPGGERIKGHEFHYYDSTDNGRDALAIKPVTDKNYPCVMAGENYWLGFPHLYYPSNPAFAKAFVDKAEKFREMMCGE